MMVHNYKCKPTIKRFKGIYKRKLAACNKMCVGQQQQQQQQQPSSSPAAAQQQPSSSLAAAI